MRTHRLESALAKEEGSGYNRPVVQLRCCAEWCGHSYRAVGCCYHPAACRNYVSDTSILPDVKTNCKTFPAFPVKIPVRLPADGDLPFLGIPPASAARGWPSDESSAVPQGKLVERCTKRTQHEDKCFVYADKIIFEPQKNVDEWKKRCYDLIN